MTPKAAKLKTRILLVMQAGFFKPNSAKTHWENDVPSSVEGERNKVISVAAIFVSRAEVMSGRATLVWEAIRKATPFNTNEVFATSSYRFILVLIYADSLCSSVIGAHMNKLKMYRRASCRRAKDIVKFLHGKIVSSPTRIYRPWIVKGTLRWNIYAMARKWNISFPRKVREDSFWKTNIGIT
jgi:hypothetical protein